MAVETQCTGCGFAVDGPVSENPGAWRDHLRFDHRTGFWGFLLGDFRDPGKRAERRLHREHLVGYTFPIDERMEILRNDLCEVARVRS